MAWWSALWHFADGTLRGWSSSAQKALAKVRRTRNMIAAMAIAIYVLVAAAVFLPEYDRYFLGAGLVVATVALWAWHMLFSIPLQAKSAVRLIDAGYPDNLKELGIRVAARKLHEESIETEELLVETAWNEGRKAYHKYKAKAMELKDELDEEPEPADKS